MLYFEFESQLKQVTCEQATFVPSTIANITP